MTAAVPAGILPSSGATEPARQQPAIWTMTQPTSFSPLVAVTADVRDADGYRWHAAPETYIRAVLTGAGGIPLIVPSLGDALDIHPTGPLWGRGELRSDGSARALESQLIEAQRDLAEGLVKAGLKQERRALRLAVRELAWR